jgi:uncharacterized protein (UPF0212 family)
MVSQNAFPKSSAKHLATRRFSQKSFVDVDLGHHRCPFSETFSALVQIRIEKITNLIYVIIMRNREHNGHAKNGSKKSEFLDRKKSEFLDPSKCIVPILVLKQK